MNIELNIERFTGKADNYNKYRPSYPQEIIKLLQSKFGLCKDSIVADIGAGTGIFSKLLATSCKCVYAVEPNQDMRNYIQGKNIKVIDGNSEKTNLCDSSVDIITVAQAFHWFEKEPTKVEFERILKKDGYIVLVWNERNQNTEFEKAYEAIGERYRYGLLRKNRYTEKEKNFFFRNDVFEKFCFASEQQIDLEQAIGRVSSMSYFPKEDTAEFDKIKKELKDLFNSYSDKGKIILSMSTEVYVGRV